LHSARTVQQIASSAQSPTTSLKLCFSREIMRLLPLIQCLTLSLTLFCLSACSNWDLEECKQGIRCTPGFKCTADGDACIPVGSLCGNGTINDEEVCDDGNVQSGDRCSATCDSDETCGNGNVDEGELCDDGNNAPLDGCSPDCMSSEGCGNNVRDTNEQCDDGNEVSGDGCNTACNFEYCGNEFREPDEICDDGNQSSGDGCSADCRSDETCGNGIVDVHEACDDGNSSAGDGCHDCKITMCGNGQKEAEEECDCGKDESLLNPEDDQCTEPNSPLGGYCRPDCVRHCGDGLVADGEQCDDEQQQPVAMYCAGATDGEVTYDMGISNKCQQCSIETKSCNQFEWWQWPPPWQSPLPNPISHTLRGVFGFAWDQVFAVGDKGLILRFDSDQKWHYETFVGSITSHTLFGVWGDNLDSLLAVGSHGTILERQRDGSWNPAPSPSGDIDFYAISGNTSHIVVVGASGRVFRRLTNNDDWEDISPAPSSNKDLYSVWTENDKILVAGASGIIQRRSQNGDWEVLPLPAGVDPHTDFYGIWGINDDIFVAGNAGTLIRIHGNKEPERMPFPFSTRILSIWGISNNNILSVGREGKIAHYDGKLWAPVRSQTGVDLYGIWLIKTSQSVAVAVGEGGGIYRFAY
jgi:cysteine-rich repeat protein